MKIETQKQNNKVKWILGLVFSLVAALFLANWIIGNILEQRLAQNIDDSLAEMEPQFTFDYENLTVNPILAQVIFNDAAFKTKDERGVIKFSWDESSYKSSYIDLWNLMQRDLKVNQKLHNLKADFNNLKISGEFSEYSNSAFIFTFSELGIDFKGTLTKKDLTQTPEKILANDQKLQLTIADFEIDLPQIFDQILLKSNLQEKLLKLTEANLMIAYNSEDRLISVKETLASSYSSAKLAGDIKLIGPNINDLKAVKFDLESDGDFAVKDLKWGIANQTGRYTIEEISGKSDFNLDHKIDLANYEAGDMILGNSDYTINLTGLKAKFSGTLKDNLTANPLVRMSGLEMNKILVDKLNLAYQTDERQIRLTEGNLASSLFDAKLNFNLEYNNQIPDLSQINNFRLELNNFKGDLRELLKMAEYRMGVSLPRSEDAVVLEVKGTFGQPKIKGIDY